LAFRKTTLRRSNRIEKAADRGNRSAQFIYRPVPITFLFRPIWAEITWCPQRVRGASAEANRSAAFCFEFRKSHKSASASYSAEVDRPAVCFCNGSARPGSNRGREARRFLPSQGANLALSAALDPAPCWSGYAIGNMRVGPNWGYFSMRVAFVVSLTLAAAATALLPASAQQSNGSCAALLIGNSNYMWGGEPPLKEPINDARSLGEELKRAGFDVDVTEDLSKEAMQRAVDGFYGKLRTGMTGLIFFSGYGIQANRQSYLIPIDVDIFNESEVRPNGISLDNVLAEMNRRGAGVKIAIIDAARRFNPFENRFRRPGAGLAPVSSPGGALVMYSATAGTPGGLVSASSAERGLFVGELLKEIRVQGVSVEEAFNRTRMRVSQASSNDQNPWISSSLSQEFTFSSCSRRLEADRDRDRVADRDSPPRVRPPPLPACQVVNVPAPKPNGPPRAMNSRASMTGCGSIRVTRSDSTGVASSMRDMANSIAPLPISMRRSASSLMIPRRSTTAAGRASCWGTPGRPCRIATAR
jgi:hypothetical protein